MLNDLLSFPWWALVLMLAGAVAIIWTIVLPISWIVAYGIGSTIFNAITLDWGMAKNNPLALAKYLFWKWPIHGMKEAVTLPVDSVTCGPWKWTPLFGYSKSKNMEG